MGGVGDKTPYRFPLTIKQRFVDDLIALFHHYHHVEENHIVHHCEHFDGVEIIHCGCKTITSSRQHAMNRKFTDCMVHLPDITGINFMELELVDECPFNKGWYHIGSVNTVVRYLTGLPKVMEA